MDNNCLKYDKLKYARFNGCLNATLTKTNWFFNWRDVKETSNFIEMYGVVTNILSGIYTVHLTNELDVEGYVCGRMKKHNIRVYEDDLVKLQLSPYDLEKGRIVFRLNPRKDIVEEELKVLCSKLNIKLPERDEDGGLNEGKSVSKKNK